MTTGYSSAQVCQATGASFRQVDYWARTRLIVPSVSAAQGSGSSRRYSFDDIVLCRLVMVLGTAQGKELPRGTGLGSLVREALATGGDWWLALPAGGPTIVTSEPAAVVAEGHDVLTLINLGVIRRHVAEALRSTAARSALEPIPLPVSEAERGVAGPRTFGEVRTEPGCTTTNNEDDLRGAIPEAVSIA